VTCYGCGQKGHIKKHCPSKNKSGKSNGGMNTDLNDGQLKKKWYNSNLENKTAMERIMERLIIGAPIVNMAAVLGQITWVITVHTRTKRKAQENIQLE